MSYTSASTRSTGYVVGSAQWNELVMNDRWANESGTDGHPQCIVYRSTNQSLSNNTDTSINWNAEIYDNSAMHSTSVNTSRLSAPVDGYYEMHLWIYFAANTTGSRGAYILWNGTGNKAVNHYDTTAVSPWDCVRHLWWKTRMTAGQYVEGGGYQNSGGSLNVLGDASAYRSYMTLEWKAN